MKQLLRAITLLARIGWLIIGLAVALWLAAAGVSYFLL